MKSHFLNKFVIWILLVLISQISQAHNPLIATYLLTNENQEWKLKIFTTLNTLHLSLLKQFDKNQLIDKKGNYNQDIAINYFKNNIKLISNKKELNLTPGTVSISNHQSQFIFTIHNGEDISDRVDVSITAMIDNLGQHNLFKIKAYNNKTHIMLSERNEYKGSVAVPIKGLKRIPKP